jgi:hypothetical protein
MEKWICVSGVRFLGSQDNPLKEKERKKCASKYDDIVKLEIEQTLL